MLSFGLFYNDCVDIVKKFKKKVDAYILRSYILHEGMSASRGGSNTVK
ncbi:YfmQ family protein [Mesobacillus subterraneus]